MNGFFFSLRVCSIYYKVIVFDFRFLSIMTLLVIYFDIDGIYCNDAPSTIIYFHIKILLWILKIHGLGTVPEANLKKTRTLITIFILLATKQDIEHISCKDRPLRR